MIRNLAVIIFVCCWATQAISADWGYKSLTLPHTESKKAEESKSNAPVSPLKPFGSFSWSDGLLDVVMKTQSTEGVDKTELCVSDSCITIGNLKTMDELSVRITELIKKKNPIYLNPNDPRVKGDLAVFTAAAGVKKVFPETQAHFYVKAKSIIIAGIPFEMRIDMEIAPGLVVKTFDKVAYNAGKLYYYPLVLKTISLDSRSPILNSKHMEIRKILESKYGICPSGKITSAGLQQIEHVNPCFNVAYISDVQIQGTVSSSGSAGGYLKVSCDKNTCSMIYENNPVIKQLDLDYKEFMSNLEQNKLKGKKDMSNSL